MTIKLTTAELSMLQTMEAQAQAKTIGHWQIYKWLGDQLETKGVASTNSALLWLRGATEANANRGAMAALIRTYTETEYQLRYGRPIPTGKMQEASDAVAQNLIKDLLGNSDDDWPRGQVPDIVRIGLRDARAVGKVLFNTDLNDTAAELKQNSAWSGTLLFTLLRSDQTDRLKGGGTTKIIDSLSDIRDVLFAYKAFDAGFKAAVTQLRPEDLPILGTTAYGYISATSTPTASLGLLKYCTDNPELKNAFQLISDVGTAKFLDMLQGAVQGKALIGTNTDASFTSAAQSFFAGYTSTSLQTMGAKLLPTDAASLASLAKGDGAEGASARAALAALSVVRVDVSDTVAQKFIPMDAATGHGNISEHWIDDRAGFTASLYKKLSGPGGNVPGRQNIHYLDVDSNIDVLVGSGSAHRIQKIFGGQGDDNISGQGFADNLYGGAGNDKLNGLGGNDRLEGGAGDDTLSGDAGSDTLVGGEGDDEYIAGDGDTIIDSDGKGHVLLGGVRLTLASKHVSEHSWQGESGEIYTRIDDDLIVEVKGERVTLQGAFKQIAAPDGYLGIGLAGDVPSVKVPTIAYIGTDTFPDDIWDSKRITGSKVIETYATESFTMGEGNDLVESKGGGDLFYGQGGDDYFFALAGDNYAEGGTGNDQLADGVAIKYVVKTVWDWVGNRWQTITAFSESFPRKEVALDNSGILMHVLPGTQRSDVDSNDTYLGGEGDDWLWGNKGIDNLKGGTGDDVVYGGAGNDDIQGEDGNDILSGDDLGLSTPPAQHGDDYIDGGAGNDQMFGNGGDDVLRGGSGDDRIWGDDALTPLQYHGDDWIVAGEGNDTAYGGGGDDLIDGDDGDDVLVGEEGNDIIDGGAGNDYLIGDLADADHRPTGTYMFASATGDDRDLYLARYRIGILNAWQQRYKPDAALAVGDDLLIGGAGNDTLVGGAGSDTLQGGSGSDTYIFKAGDGFDVISDDSGGDSSVDTLRLGQGLSAAYIFASRDGSDLILNWCGPDFITVRGHFSDDGRSRIEQFAFSDGQVWSADDMARWVTSSHLGSSDDDELVGGAGADRYLVNSAGDTVVEQRGGGIDTVMATVSHVLADNVENLELLGDAAIDAGGNALNNILTGNSASNTFLDGDGNDTVHGAGGDDLIRTDLGWEQNFYDGGAGTDTVDYSVRTYDGARTYGGFGGVGGVWVDLAAGMAWRYRYGSQYYDGIPDQLVSIENAKGSNLRDFLVGDAGANRLEGLAGDDRLAGGGGADTLIGGLGNDTYVVNDADSLLVEYEGEGVDTVEASLSYLLPIQIENLTLTGKSAINGTGNERNNEIRGNSGQNILDGAAGDDVFYDGDGNDTVRGGEGNDLIRTNLAWEQNAYDGGAGIDTVDYGLRLYEGGRTYGGFGGLGGVWVDLDAGKAWRYRYGAQYYDGIPDTLSSIENVVGSNLRDFLVGDAGANRLEGGAGDDKLVGGAGADTLLGGLGQDTLTGGAGADTFVFVKSDAGEDRITDFKVLDGDQLDLSRLLQGVVLDWSSPTSVGRYLKLLGSGDDALLKVAPTGSGNFDAAELTITLSKGWSAGGMNLDLIALHDQRVILA